MFLIKEPGNDRRNMEVTKGDESMGRGKISRFLAKNVQYIVTLYNQSASGTP